MTKKELEDKIRELKNRIDDLMTDNVVMNEIIQYGSEIWTKESLNKDS